MKTDGTAPGFYSFFAKKVVGMKVFDLQGKGTNFIAEILAGITTFVTMTYLLIACPAILAAGGAQPGSAYLSVCLACFLGSLLMGFIANQPFVAGPSLGMTIFFSSTLLTELDYTYTQALLITLLAGLVVLVFTLAGFQNAIFNAIPKSLKNGISAGLGIYMALVGLKNAGFLSTDSGGQWSLLNFSERGRSLWAVGLMFFGILLIGLFRKLHFGASTTLAILASGMAYYLGTIAARTKSLSSLSFRDLIPAPQLGSFNSEAYSLWGQKVLFKNLSEGFASLFFSDTTTWKTVLSVLVTIMICSLFNSVESNGVIYVTARGQLDENGHFGSLKKTMLASSISSSVSSCMGSPLLSVAPESSAGMAADGKTGLTAVTAALLFLLASMFPSVTTLIPPVITSCVMVLIGVNMLGAVKDIDFGNIAEGVPAIISMILIPFTSSVIDGIAVGLIVHMALNLLTFQFKSVKIIEIAVAAVFVFSYFMI